MSFYTQEELIKIGFKKVGINVSVSRKASIYNPHNISIGDYSRIDDFCVLSAGEGGLEIGCHVHIAVYSSLIGQGKIIIEDFANLSSRVSVYSSNDDYSGNSLTNPTIPDKYKNVFNAPVIIKKHVIIGSSTVVLPGVVLGVGAAIGAQSLVNKDCSAFTVYAGSPIKYLKARSRNLLEKEILFLNELNYDKL